MGVMDRLFQRIDAATSIRLPITSPYSDGAGLSKLLVADLLGEEQGQLAMSREDAIALPSVSKARNLLVATVAKFPLRAIASAEGVDTDVTVKHPWLYRTNGTVSPYERMAWTVDDLIFYGCSVWLINRGAPENKDDPSSRRPILAAERCHPSRWEIRPLDGGYHLFVDDAPITDDGYIFINSPFEGLLNIGQRTLKGARDTENAWTGRARNPIPMVELHVTDDDALDEGDITKFVDAWAAARTAENGAIGYTPQGVELRVHGTSDPALMVEGRNAIRTDIGSYLNVRVAMLDGTIGVDSLTYSTKDGERNAFYEFDLPFWTDCITARLSLDDVVPRGTRIRFDMYEAQNLPTPTGARVED